MNYALLSKILGTLLLVVSAAMFVCLVFALVERHQGVANAGVAAFTWATCITFATGAAMAMAGIGSSTEMLRKEAIAAVGLGWLLSAGFGAIPFMLCEPSLSPVRAFYESMSGLTTTGGTVIEDLTRYPRSVLLWRNLSQWIGGLGILVLFVALLSYLGVGSRSLMRHESSLQLSEGGLRIHEIALRLWGIYIGLTIICAAGLAAIGYLVPEVEVTTFDAITHSMSAISTGGFSPHNDSVGHFGSLAVEVWIAVFMLLGAINFMLYLVIVSGRLSRKKKLERLKAEDELWFYLKLLGLATLLICLDFSWFSGEQGFLQALRNSFFSIISLSTSTGFTTENYDAWPPGSRKILFFLMIVGGSAGSTAGGIKVSRILVFLRLMRHEVVRSFRPSRVFSLSLNGVKLDEASRMQVAFYLALITSIALVAAVFLTITEPLFADFDSAAGAIVSSLFNIGPGFGTVGPDHTLAGLADRTLLALSMLMLLGRLELFAVLVLFVPGLWKRF